MFSEGGGEGRRRGANAPRCPPPKPSLNINSVAYLYNIYSLIQEQLLYEEKETVPNNL